MLPTVRHRCYREKELNPTDAMWRRQWLPLNRCNHYWRNYTKTMFDSFVFTWYANIIMKYFDKVYKKPRTSFETRVYDTGSLFVEHPVACAGFSKKEQP